MIEESVVDECFTGESSTMDDVEEGPSKQTISESKVEEIHLPNVAEEFIVLLHFPTPTLQFRKYIKTI